MHDVLCHHASEFEGHTSCKPTAKCCRMNLRCNKSQNEHTQWMSVCFMQSDYELWGVIHTVHA